MQSAEDHSFTFHDYGLVKSVPIAVVFRTGQVQDELDSEIGLVRSACQLQTSCNQKSKASSQGATYQGWNKVSLLKLITGRS